MSFYGEGAWEVEIDGAAVFSANDAEGAPVGAFGSEAEALGAQREVNLKKLLLKKLPSEFDDGEIWGCEAVFDDGTSVELFAERVEGEWLIATALEDSLNERQLPSARPI